MLSAGSHSCVSLGFLLDDDFRRRVRFWDDPEIPRAEANLTCERCHPPAAEWPERVAEPVLPSAIGEAIVSAPQRGAEKRHARIRREVLRMDQRLGDLLAFSGPGE